MNSKIKMVFGVMLVIVLIALVWFFLMKSQTPAPASSQPTPTISSMPPATNESPSFLNTVWVTMSIADKPLVANTTITAQFDDKGRLSGNDGCNSFSTQYTMNGLNLTINQAIVSTKKACDEAVMNQADAFTKALLATTSYKLGDGMMVLNQGASSGLTFSGQTNPLSKTSWNVTGYNNGKQAVVSPITGTTPTVTFGDDGTISGSASCNTFSGQYSLNGQSITIGPLATTTRECIEPEGISQQETAFMNALKSAVVWQMQGNQLSLRTKDDQLAITATNTLQ